MSAAVITFTYNVSHHRCKEIQTKTVGAKASQERRCVVNINVMPISYLITCRVMIYE